MTHSSVTKIGDYAFSDCCIESIDIPSSVTSIGEGAFAWCDWLETVTLTNSVKEVKGSIFDNTSLTDIYFVGSEAEWVELGIEENDDLEGVTIHFVDYVAASGILTDSHLAVKIGTTAELVPVFIPENATDKRVVWSSDNEAVVTVKNGIIEPKSVGTANVTVTAKDGGFKAVCQVSVVEKEPQNISVPLLTEVTYGTDEAFDLTVIPDETAQLDEFTYESDNEAVATVSAEGTVAIVGIGQADITVKRAGNETYAPFIKKSRVIVNPKEVIVSSINADEKTAVLEGILDGDAESVALDFDKINIEVIDEIDEATDSVRLTSFELKGEKAKNYTVATESIETTMTKANIVTVTVAAQNGTVSGAGTYIKGSKVVLTATPDSGYSFNGWSVGGQTVGTETAYTYIAEESIEITANFKKKSSGGGGGGGGSSKDDDKDKDEDKKPEDNPPKAEDNPPKADSFKDIDKNAWYYTYVRIVCEADLMNGVGDNRFAPSNTVDRGMYVTVLYRIAGEPNAAGNSFKDVSDSAYYAKAVSWASRNGIVNGVSSTEFAPTAEITREQMATMVYRFIGNNEAAAAENLMQFTDSGAISDYAKEALSWAVAKGILTGKGDGVLDPKGLTTRAELAAVLVRLTNIIK